MVLKQKSFNIYKRVGETPLGAIERIRAKFPDFSTEKMTYAGRLDPLAEGVLIILIGEECKNKEKYLGLDKEYEVEFLLGVGTDTGDVMGLCEFDDQEEKLSKTEIKLTLNTLLGKKHQVYPKYSSPRLAGQKEGFKEVTIKEVEFINEHKICSRDLFETIKEKIDLVQGDFRQPAIIDCWSNFLANDRDFILVKCRVVCTSGTYIRVLAEEFGEKLKTRACVFSLRRTRVGDITEADCLKFSGFVDAQ